MTDFMKSYAGVSAVMAVLVALLFVLSPLLGKRYKAKSLYVTWVILLLGFLIPLRIQNIIPAITAPAPPIISQPLSVSHTPAFPTDVEYTRTSQSGDADTTGVLNAGAQTGAETGLAVSGSSWTWIDLITAVWLAGAAAALVFHTLRYALFLRSVRRWKYPVTNQAVQRTFSAELRRMGIKKAVRLYHCASIESPMMVGLVHPMLLLPEEDYTEDELSLVFRHELVHLKRRDLFVKLGLTLACALHWYNPAVYVLCKQISFWQESSCDEAVISNGSLADKQFYSETIIRVIRRQVRTRSALTTTF